MAGSDFVEMFVGVGAARVRGKNNSFLKIFYKKKKNNNLYYLIFFFK